MLRVSVRNAFAVALLILCGFVLHRPAAALGGQSASQAQPALPPGATGLEGSPTVRIETTADGTTRRVLTAKEAHQHPLSISVIGGRYFWSNGQNEELTPRQSGEVIYLTSATPGRYVRFTRINDRLTYVEHVDMGAGSVTYFGELRIVLGK